VNLGPTLFAFGGANSNEAALILQHIQSIAMFSSCSDGGFGREIFAQRKLGRPGEDFGDSGRPADLFPARRQDQ